MAGSQCGQWTDLGGGQEFQTVWVIQNRQWVPGRRMGVSPTTISVNILFLYYHYLPATMPTYHSFYRLPPPPFPFIIYSLQLPIDRRTGMLFSNLLSPLGVLERRQIPFATALQCPYHHPTTDHQEPVPLPTDDIRHSFIPRHSTTTTTTYHSIVHVPHHSLPGEVEDAIHHPIWR